MPARKKAVRGQGPAAGKADGSLRVRMYRVGFGDFFLLTFPSPGGPQHVLVDCGVTSGATGKGDIGTIKTAVRHMAAETKGKLALIIVTHRHQDHIIGFSRCEEVFRPFQVGAIWMSYWETEYDAQVAGLQADLASLAVDLQQHLAAKGSGGPEEEIVKGVLENATGFSAAEGPGGGTNARSLSLLKQGLGVKPEYLHRGQTPKLPPSLVAAGVGAEILGPPAPDALTFMRLTDLKKGVGQYLDAANTDHQSSRGGAFGTAWRVSPSDYPPSAFREFAPRVDYPELPDFTTRYPERIEKAIAAAQPAALLTAAKQLDDFLNNQSLVVLFTWNGKNLLFAGDAQGGSWEYWLFDLDKPSTTGTGQPLTAASKSILGSLDFYKVGHHGSTNATPIAAVEAMGDGFAAMCSTQADTFGSEKNQSEVPRIPLLEALEKRTRGLVRSDEFAVDVEGLKVQAAVATPAPALPEPQRGGRFEVGSCYVDYLL